MSKILLIGLGGAVGTLLRYGVAGWVQRAGGSGFPVGTLVVNCTGCLAIGFLGMLLTGPVLVREELRIALLVGVLGGFTTFSTFGSETMSLVGDGQFRLALANVLLSNGLGLAAVWLGHRAGERLFGV